MKYNALLSEFTMVCDHIANQPLRAASMVGIMFNRKEAETLRMNLSVVAESLEEYVRRMIGVCAFRVSIPALGKEMWAAPNMLKSQLSPTNRKRIQFVDRKQAIWDDLGAYLHPIFDDLLIVEPMTSKEQPLKDLLRNLIWDIYILTLASRHHCEAVLSPTKVLTRIDTLIRNDQLSSESLSRLSVVRGLFALYSNSQDIPGFCYIGHATQASLSERLDEILEDAYLLEASHLRRFLGFKENTKAIKRDLRNIIKFIVKNRPWAKGILAATTQTAMLSDIPGNPVAAILQAILSKGSDLSDPLLISPVTHRKDIGARMIATYRRYPSFSGAESGGSFRIVDNR
jgi:hypothetical protein